MRIFEHRILDAEFQRYGYAVVNLLSDDQVRELSEIHRRHPLPDTDLAFVTSMLVHDYEYRRAVDHAIKAVLQDALHGVMHDHRVFHASFVVKKPGQPSGARPIHQDPALVDERKHMHFTVWCPLDEINADNGWLGVVAGSHRFNRGFRSTGAPYSNLYPLMSKRLLTYLPVRPGQVVFLHPRAFHCSPSNRTERSRVVATGAVISRDCDQFYFCYRDRQQGEHAVELFEVDDDFFLHHVFGRRPSHGRLHSVLSSPPESVDAQRLLDVCGALVRQPTDRAIVDGWSI